MMLFNKIKIMANKRHRFAVMLLKRRARAHFSNVCTTVFTTIYKIPWLGSASQPTTRWQLSFKTKLQSVQIRLENIKLLKHCCITGDKRAKPHYESNCIWGNKVKIEWKQKEVSLPIKSWVPLKIGWSWTRKKKPHLISLHNSDQFKGKTCYASHPLLFHNKWNK